ncbi:protein halfway-like [Oratosquilla oratoria]|uniref:protein halfway-like n=1 Tax=Oratosquilla oratoria TaxID=337810 RepID=UPI003F75760F
MVGSMWQLYCTTVFLLFSPVVPETIVMHSDSLSCDIERNETDKVKIVCHNLDRLDTLQTLKQDVQQLTIINGTFVDDVSLTLPPFPELEHVIFKRSFLNFSSNSKPWPANLIKLSSLTFEDCWSQKQRHEFGLFYELSFKSENFELLPALKTLNFYNNTLLGIHSIHLLKKLEHKNIEGGTVFCNCSDEWYRNWSEVDPHFSKESLCYAYSSFLSGACKTVNSIPAQTHLETMKVTKELCPPKCNCSLTGFKPILKAPFVMVNCTNIGLKEMPEQIPPMATSFDYRNNELQSIDALFKNPNYKRIVDAFVGSNKIEEININKELFSDFLHRKNDVVLHLENNQLRKLPIEVLEYIIKMDKDRAFFMFLSGNPWDCVDCNFIRNLQTVLVRHGGKYYEDFHTIRCAVTNQRVILVKVDEKCPIRRPMDTIDYLNIAVALVFISSLANFLYNLHNYRTHNRLPWIIYRLRKGHQWN